MSAYRVIEKKNLWYLLSLLVIGSGVLLMAFRGIQSQPVLNYGIDFVGGNSMLLKFDRIDDQVTGDLSGDENIDFIEGVREVLIGYGLENSSIQINQDRDVMIKTLVDTNIENTQIIDALRETFGQIEVLEIDFIGPTIGKELKDKALLILAVACVALLLFITWRFEFAYGLAALIALFHDALVTVSLSAMIGIEINTAFVAAVLTILGYSINDTIVIFDRIRENYPKLQKQHSLIQIANFSLTQTIHRTINTSVTTMAVILSLIFFGGTTIKAFCLVLLIGIVSGTYSSFFIASPVLVQLNPYQKDD